MGLPIVVAFAILLLCTVLPHSILVPSRVGSTIVIAGYGVFGLLAVRYWHDEEGVLHALKAGLRTIYPTGLVCLSLIAFLYVFHVAFGNYETITNAISGLVLPAIVVFNFVYVPRVISPDTFLRVLAVTATLLVGVGVVIYAAVAAGIAPVTILWPYTATVPIAGLEFRPLRSVTTNPNTFGQFAFAGSVASVALFDRDGRAMYGAFAVVTALGLLATASRASVFSAAVAFGVYAVYRRFGRRTLLVTIGLLVFAIGGMLAVIPTLNRIGYQITFTGRVELWYATVRAIGQRPFLGYGLGETSEMIAPFVDRPLLTQYGPHNSYLRMTLHLGLLGGIAYLALTAWAFLKHFRGERIDAAFVAIATGFAVNQLFEEHTMFEPIAAAVVMTTVFGYLVVERTRPRRRDSRRRHRRRTIGPRPSDGPVAPGSVPTRRQPSRRATDRDSRRPARRRPAPDRRSRSETDDERPA